MIKVFQVSMPLELHSKLKDLADKLPITMNNFIAKAIEEKIERETK